MVNSTNYQKSTEVSTGFGLKDTNTDKLLLQNGDYLLLQNNYKLLLGGMKELHSTNYQKSTINSTNYT